MSNDNLVSTKDLLLFVKLTLGGSINTINNKMDNLSLVINNKTDSLSVSINTLHKKFIMYERHSQHCDSKFNTIDAKFKLSDDKFKRDYDCINVMRDQVKDINYIIEDKVKEVKSKFDILEKASDKSKNTTVRIIGIAMFLMSLLSFWNSVQNKDTYVKKEDLKSIVMLVNKMPLLSLKILVNKNRGK